MHDKFHIDFIISGTLRVRSRAHAFAYKCASDVLFVRTMQRTVSVWTHRTSTRFHSVLYLALVSGDNATQLIPLTRPRLALCEGVKLRAWPVRSISMRWRRGQTSGPLTHYMFVIKLRINSGKRVNAIASHLKSFTFISIIYFRVHLYMCVYVRARVRIYFSFIDTNLYQSNTF